jgi:hypothetical protein
VTGDLISGGTLREALVGARFFLGVPRLLRRPIRLEEAPGIVRRRRDGRAAAFLAIVRRGVYDTPGSPYRALLRHAHCEYGDLEALVRRDGVDDSLRALLRQGVYLTVDEYKGREPIVRGPTTVWAGPAALRNPAAALHVPARTGGSRGAGTPLLVDLEFVRECGTNGLLALASRGGAGWLKAHWLVPGGSALARLLEFASFGAPPVCWFTQVDPGQPGLHPRYRWSGRIMRWASLLAGRPLPRPRYVSVEDPEPIARWLATTLESGATPYLYTYPSCAVRVSEAARAAGLAVEGARFTVVGEPLTAARRAAIEALGVQVAPRYAGTDTGPLGDACGAPEAPDDVHVYDDLHALIQPEDHERPPGLPPGTLLVSSLRPRAPFVLLNVSLGDSAILRRRRCGCAMETWGWSTHLHTIRSYEKLTAGGMNFMDSDVLRVLEEVLPGRFGGAPTDYQLVDEEAPDGRPRIRLLVHPRLGPLDPARVGDAFLAALGRGSGAERVMEFQWRNLRLLDVERRAPRVTRAGKILHLHAETPAPPGGLRA